MGIFSGLFSKKKTQFEEPIPELNNKEKALLDRIDEAMKNLLAEYKKYPYKDKIIVNTYSKYEYKFEDGNKKKISFIQVDATSKFEINIFENIYCIDSNRIYNTIKKILNILENHTIHRPKVEYKSSTTSSGNSSNYSKSSSNTYSQTTNKVIPVLNNPLKDKYNLLVRQIKLRQNEINNMPLTDAKRKPLVNELVAYKKAADKIKAKILKSV